MGLEGFLTGPRTNMPLDAYVDYDTGQTILAAGRDPSEIRRGIELARAYRRDLRSLDQSELGAMLAREANSRGYRPQRIRASGVSNLEASLPGALQATTYIGRDAVYSRDARLYRAKLEHMARRRGVTDTDLIHRYATIHEYMHGRGVRSEKENHLLVYRALERAVAHGDPKRRDEYERLLEVERGELRERYNIRMRPGTSRAQHAPSYERAGRTSGVPTRRAARIPTRHLATLPKRTLGKPSAQASAKKGATARGSGSTRRSRS